MRPGLGDALRSAIIAEHDPALAVAAALPVGGPDRLAFGTSAKMDTTGFVARAGVWARGTTRGGVEWGAQGSAFLERDWRTGVTDAGLWAGFRARW